MLLCDLALVPPEIGVHILNQLLPEDSRQMLTKLEIFDREKAPIQLEALGWLYARLYGRILVVYIDTGNLHNHESNCDFAATPTEMLLLSKDRLFLKTIPKKLEFKITRDMREHTQFQHSLSTFVEMILASWADKYFGAVPEIKFHLNGECTLAVSPTLMLVAILNVLANLTLLTHCNMSFLSITRTHIGQMFPHKWQGVFRHFASVKHLILDHNAISLATPNLPEFTGHNVKWPHSLESLSLAGNDLQTVSSTYLSELPNSLKRLSFSGNKIANFASNDATFLLATALPNLTELDLSENPYLSYLDARILGGSRNCTLTVNLKGCRLVGQCMESLQEQARQAHAVILF
ncbi:hypothetical protein METSCH_E02820 [Metschnikowia aff. pulcherrima]|uniref:Uncharacterized protein n=1 Tax=Metschnikowia aff. pulcherrima TaxID=2163413 RepID=A0A4V1AEQ6_9ASCO|nr:hypothetical protein METSCH_E02820 [Metschnikowia aff. pulcherrima]